MNPAVNFMLFLYYIYVKKKNFWSQIRLSYHDIYAFLFQSSSRKLTPTHDKTMLALPVETVQTVIVYLP